MSSFSLVRPSAIFAPKAASCKVAYRSSVVMRVAEKGPSSMTAETPSTGAAPVAPSKPYRPFTRFFEVMNWYGIAPEVTNGRLAMLGFVAALNVELTSHQTVMQQLEVNGDLFDLTIKVFTVASMITAFSEVKNTKSESFGPFTPFAELINGRAAMIGFFSLLALEAIDNGAALF